MKKGTLQVWSRACRFRWACAVAGLVAAGVCSFWGARRFAAQSLRHELAQQALLAVPGVSVDDLPGLASSGVEPVDPPRELLERQLRALRLLDPAWRAVWVVRRGADGASLDTLRDSEPADASETSPFAWLGATFAPKPSGAPRERAGSSPVARGPMATPQGLRAAVCVPLLKISPDSDRWSLQVVVDASGWAVRSRSVERSAVVFTCVLGLILLLAFATRSRPADGSGVAVRWRFREELLCVATGVTLSLAAARVAHHLERANEAEAFAALMQVASGQVAERFLHLDRLHVEGVGRFFEGSEEVTESEFHRYTEPLKRTPEVLALGWAPIALADSIGTSTCCRVAYVEGREERAAEWWRNRDLCGFPAVREALKRASSSRRVVAVPFAAEAAVPGTADGGLLLVRAVHRDGPGSGLKGYVLAAVAPEALLQSVSGRLRDAHEYIHLELRLLRSDEPPLVLAGMSSDEPSAAGPVPTLGSDLTRPLWALDGMYAVVGRPAKRLMALDTSPLRWGVLLAGLLITVAGALVVHVADLRGQELERLVARRSGDLASSMRRYDRLARNSRTVAWTVDVSGLFVDVSDVCEPVLGYRRDELVSKMHYYDLHPEEGRLAFRRRTLEVMASKQPFHDLLNPMVAKSGEIVWMSTSGVPLLGPDGRLLGYEGADTDVTFRKRLDRFRELNVRTLQLLRGPGETEELLRRLVQEIREGTGFDGVGIRLQVGNDYPHVAKAGFVCGHASEGDGLAVVGVNGEPLLDAAGKPFLRCICGCVIAERPPMLESLWTEAGSCWSNDVELLLAALSLSADGCCIPHGQGSVAAVPIRDNTGVIGLLQLNHSQQGQLSLEIVQMLECIAAHVGEALMRKRVERDFEMLFHGMHEGFALHELVRDDSGEVVDLRCLEMNPAYGKLTGVRALDAVGRPLRELIPNVTQDWFRALSKVAVGGEAIAFQAQAPESDRVLRVSAFRPRPDQCAVIVSDITGQAHAEREARESHRQCASLMALVPGMGFRCRVEGGARTMVFVSQGAAGLTGYQPEEFVEDRSVDYADLVAPSDRGRRDAWWSDAVRTTDAVGGEYLISTRSGTTKRVRERIVGLQDASGRILTVEGYAVELA